MAKSSFFNAAQETFGSRRSGGEHIVSSELSIGVHGDIRKTRHYKIHQGETPEQRADAVRDILYELGVRAEDCKFRKFASDKALTCVAQGTDRDENSLIWQFDDDTSKGAEKTTYADNLSDVLKSGLVLKPHITNLHQQQSLSGKDDTPAFALWLKTGLRRIRFGSNQCEFRGDPKKSLVAVFSVYGELSLPAQAKIPSAKSDRHPVKVKVGGEDIA